MNTKRNKSVYAMIFAFFAAAVFFVCRPLLPVQAAESENLLVNGSGETGDLTGWTDAAEEETGDGTFSAIDIYEWGGSAVEPGEGDYFFFAGATEGNFLYQDVDVRDYADGTLFTLSGYMNGWEDDHGDNAYLELEFLDRKGKSLGKDSVCEPSVAGWEFYSVSLEKPKGAVKVRVSLIAERNTGSDCDSYFDGITLTAQETEVPEEPEQAKEPVVKEESRQKKRQEERSVSENLLVNGSGETGDLTGWTDAAEEETGDGTFSVMDIYEWGDSTVEPNEGDYFFFAGATEGNFLYQDVDVRDYPDGTVFTLSGYMNGWEDDHGDNSYLELEFLDRRGRSLGKESVCEPSIAGWELYSVSLEKPEGAVRARVSLIAERNTGSDCDSYFDGISLTADETAEAPEKTEPSAGGKENAAKDVNDYEILWTNFNTAAVNNDSPGYLEMNVNDEVRLESVTTYHWNNGQGETPGQIRICEGNKVIGTWEASGRPGSGAENVLWDIFPDIILEAGHTYQFLDSSPETWSNNPGSDNEGFMELRGYFTEDEAEGSETEDPDGEEGSEGSLVIGDANYELSLEKGKESSSGPCPVYIACDPEKGEIQISYVGDGNYFSGIDPDDPDSDPGLQKTVLYRKSGNGRWQKVRWITTRIIGADHPGNMENAYRTIILKFYDRKKEMDFLGGEYAVKIDIDCGGHHRMPEGAELLELADVDEIMTGENTAPAEDKASEKEDAGAVEDPPAGGNDQDAAADAGQMENSYLPSAYAVSGGKWFTLQSGERIYELADGTSTRNVWVEDGGQYYYIDFSGCLMKGGCTADGFTVDQDGRWIEDIPMRTDDPEPLDTVRYGTDPWWTFELIRYADNSHYCIATRSYSFGHQETFDVTPLGHGCYLLEDMDDPEMALQMSVAPDRNSITVSGLGETGEFEAQ